MNKSEKDNCAHNKYIINIRHYETVKKLILFFVNKNIDL